MLKIWNFSRRKCKKSLFNENQCCERRILLFAHIQNDEALSMLQWKKKKKNYIHE